METKKNEVSNAMNIGQQITKNDFNTLTANYQQQYDTALSFIIDANIIKENLNFNNKVAGIRFMYGLKDSLNPTSKVLFLIPCTSISTQGISTESILKKEGYHDHEGNLHPYQEVLLMMSQYIQNVSKNNPEFNYKEITRGNFYGANSLNSLLTDECSHIQYNLGLLTNVISPVMKALDVEFNQINEIYMDFSQPCPNDCGGPDCLATLAVDNENELNEFRYFRDNHLLHLEGGAQLFEMYYFISPLVTKIMNQNPNKSVALYEFYQERIVPFKQLLQEEKYQKAVYALKETLFSLFEEYEYSQQSMYL